MKHKLAGRKYTTFYLPLLKLACIFLKIEVYIMQEHRHGEGTPCLYIFIQKVHFASFLLLFSRKCTIISDLDSDFERVLKLQQLLYFHSRTQALCKSSKSTDNMKLDFSSDADSRSENSYKVTFYRWHIVEKKIISLKSMLR